MGLTCRIHALLWRAPLAVARRAAVHQRSVARGLPCGDGAAAALAATPPEFEKCAFTALIEETLGRRGAIQTCLRSMDAQL